MRKIETPYIFYQFSLYCVCVLLNFFCILFSIVFNWSIYVIDCLVTFRCLTKCLPDDEIFLRLIFFFDWIKLDHGLRSSKKAAVDAIYLFVICANRRAALEWIYSTVYTYLMFNVELRYPFSSMHLVNIVIYCEYTCTFNKLRIPLIFDYNSQGFYYCPTITSRIFVLSRVPCRSSV